MIRRRPPRPLAALATGLVLVLPAAEHVSTHPMPNTDIAISLNDDGVRLDIALPVPELLLALPRSFPRDADLLAAAGQRALAVYFAEHAAVISSDGTRRPHVLESMTISQAVDVNVGHYPELRVRLWTPAAGLFNPREFALAYDAIIHQVPSHFALVTIEHDVRGGVLAGGGAELGVIRFDFSQNRTPPLAIAAAPGSLARGFGSAIALGFHHVATGFDHILFLLTLLVVAPLRVVDGRWSLFQGWRRSMRRFLAISLAFTSGHSLALAVGAYDVVPVPRSAVEMAIAASILLAAIHAIRPLFAGREWLVAAVFGTIHGLAFSESLVGLSVSALLKAVAVLGFNLGVEGAQLAVMALALPLLIASRWRMFHVIRSAAMVFTAVLAAVWFVEGAG